MISVLVAASHQAVSAQDGGSAPVAGQGSDAKQGGVPKRRPKVGLVLSGGGARGFAHIGALRVLEENRIPVHYVAGASMGALVGATYATGRTPAEMREPVGTLDWDDLLRGSPPYDELSFRRKEDRRNVPSPLTLRRVRRGLSLPNSLNPGHEIGLLFDRLTLPYATVTDFDDLPIPFCCVGTDMVGAETVVLKSGSLSRALRATMAIPAVFAPVEIDGKILSDGGLLNNIPTDVVKAMGADVVVVVNIETQLGDRPALESLVGVLGQTILVATVENSRRSLRQADLIIAPDLRTYTTADCDASGAIIDLGYRGAAPKAFLLQSLALGGPLRIGGYGSEEFRASNYLQGGAGLLHQPFSLPRALGGRFYVGGWYEGGSAFENFGGAVYRQSVTGGALMETRVGPVFIGGSLAAGGRGKFYFSLGRLF